MAGIDLTTAESMLDTWIQASVSIAAGQSVTLDGRTLTRANLRDVQAQIDFWDSRVKRLTTQATRAPLQRVVFRG